MLWRDLVCLSGSLRRIFPAHHALFGYVIMLMGLGWLSSYPLLEAHLSGTTLRDHLEAFTFLSIFAYGGVLSIILGRILRIVRGNWTLKY